MVSLLVVDCNSCTKWETIFQGLTISGEQVRVEQAGWEDILLVSYPNSCIVTLRETLRPIKKPRRTFSVDFVFIRSVTRGIRNCDYRNILLGFIHNNLPSVNSLLSIYLCCERPTSFAALKNIEIKLGHDQFPLVQQTFYASHREMAFPPDFPIVCKVGHAQSGYGKMKIASDADFDDFSSVCGLMADYVTAESFVEWDWDGRVQKIGRHYRAFRRTSNHWKGNATGYQSRLEEIEITPIMKRWVDECSTVFGGLDIIGLDFVHSKKEDKFYILELNDTAIGLFHDVEAEDTQHLRELVTIRMQEHFEKSLHSVDEDLPLQAELRNAKDTIAALQLHIEELTESLELMKNKIEESAQTKLPIPQSKSKWHPAYWFDNN